MPGLNGAARLQIVSNAVEARHLNFDEYLHMVSDGPIKKLHNSSETESVLGELLAEDEFLMACLPFKSGAGQTFPARELATLCIDSPSVGAIGEDVVSQIFFPHYYNTPAISREDYLNLMVTLSMLLKQDFLLLQKGSGALFKINTDTKSENLGEIEKIGIGPIHNSAWLQEMLAKFSSSAW